MSNMRSLLLKQWKREIIHNIILGFVFFLLVFIAYKTGKSFLFKVMSVVKSLPEAACAVLGIFYSTETGNILFYFLFTELFLQAWLAWKACAKIAYMIRGDELSGRVYNVCNQLFSRKQLAICYYLCGIIYTLTIYLVWNGILLLFALVGSFNQEQRIASLLTVSRVSLKGTFVLILLISVSFMCSTVLKRRNEGRPIANLLVFGTLLLGNGFKLVDLMIVTAGYLEKDTGSLQAISAAMRNLSWLSPLSWMNPFSQAKWNISAVQMIICILGSGLSFYIGLYLYRRRSFIQTGK